MKLKVYIMHSEKVNYKEEIYKPLLEKGLLNNYFLILPMTQKYISSYVKELIIDSDIVICDLTKFNMFSNIELKIANKLAKDIRYFINKEEKNIKKYKNLELILYDNKYDFVDKVEQILNAIDPKQIMLQKENIYCLGKIQK